MNLNGIRVLGGVVVLTLMAFFGGCRVKGGDDNIGKDNGMLNVLDLVEDKRVITDEWSGGRGVKALREKIEDIISDYDGEIGVGLIVNFGIGSRDDGGRNVGRGEEIKSDTLSINDVKEYPMMSVFKLHQALAVCNELERGGEDLDSVLIINREEMDELTWSPMVKDYKGERISISIRELLRYALSQSDNNASNVMFQRIVGVDATDGFILTLLPRATFSIKYTEGEMKRDHTRAYDNATSPLGAAMLMNRLMTDSIISKEHQDFIIETLRECVTGADRISAPLIDIPGVIVAHKTGSGYSANGVLAAHNDVAYITLPSGRSYALAVFVKDLHGDEALASEVIARISSAVYEAVKN